MRDTIGDLSENILRITIWTADYNLDTDERSWEPPRGTRRVPQVEVDTGAEYGANMARVAAKNKLSELPRLSLTKNGRLWNGLLQGGLRIVWWTTASATYRTSHVYRGLQSGATNCQRSAVVKSERERLGWLGKRARAQQQQYLGSMLEISPSVRV